MDIKPDLKRKIVLLAMTVAVSFILALGTDYFFKQDKDHTGDDRDKLESVLIQKEDRLIQILEMVLKERENFRPFEKLYKNIPENLYDEEGLAVFLYRNDSLMYWSENAVYAEPVLAKDSFSKPFMQYSNGWYRIIKSTQENYRAIGLILIKSDFPYQNQYLVNEFQKDFNLHSEALIDTIPGKYTVSSRNGEYLFSVSHGPGSYSNNSADAIILALFIIFQVALVVLLFFLYHLFDFFRKYPLLLFIAFIFDAFLLRFIFLYFEFPEFIYNTKLFGPYLYATSFISPSLGDLLMNSIFWLTLSALFFYKFNYSWPKINAIARSFIGFILLLATAVLFFLLISTFRKIVMDSNIELNLNNIFTINAYSGIAYLSLTCLSLAFFLVSARIIALVLNSGITRPGFLMLSLIASAAIILLFPDEFSSRKMIFYPLLLFSYFLLHLYFSGKKGGFRNITGALVFIVCFSLIATYVLDYYLNLKEKENRKIIASELTATRDPMLEYEFVNARSSLLADTSVLSMLKEVQEGKMSDDEIGTIISDRYFRDFRNNYDLFITICKPGEELIIQPEGFITNCFTYFEGIFSEAGCEEVAPDFYFMNRKLEKNNYIGCIGFELNQENRTDTIRIFVELVFKYLYESGLGYPDLLIDNKSGKIPDISGYSYARYLNGKLVYKNGDFNYHLGFQPYDKAGETTYFIDSEKFSHYVNKLDDENILVISKKNPSLIDLAAPFSYLFIVFSLFLLFFLLGFILLGGSNKLEFNFGNQLQVSIIIIIVFSFLVLGLITRSNIISLYNAKNRDNLSEKTFSVLTELEHKLANEEVLTPEMSDYIADYLNKFSQVFFSDINLYDTSGTLISSSRPQIFEEKLLSVKMNPDAWYKLAFDESLLYIQNERIGRQEYLSAYIPFRNNQDRIIAYLNLPYFAKQTELRKEIGDFLAAYINVYVLLIVLAIMVTILVSRFITRPLKLIREKLQNIELGKPNEKIVWKKKDEIGDLVEEYNRMIDELAVSAEMLAKSERESAWREMAKQVAHEIKNPLTPMKLSVQYLQKAWNEKNPDWEKHLAGFTKTIVEQIDSLSDIASAFSDFAKMPAAKLERIELGGIITSAADIFHLGNIKMEAEYIENEMFVVADRKHLLRVYNNLLQNAVQAIGRREDGLIKIRAYRDGDYWVTTVSDNGTGITEEQALKIFSPSFTTKSSGMGLGLAMVRSILTSINGSVSFDSRPGEGATFIVKIPVAK